MARPKTMAVRKIVNLPEGMLDQIKDFWHAERLPNESEAIRRLIELGLKADSHIDSLEEDIATLRIVAREWAEKAGADQKVLDAIDSDDPGAASSNPWLRKIKLGPDAPDDYVRSVEKPPRQKFPKPPKKL